VAFVSKTPPVGTFTKFVWQLTSIIHVKQVLDNPLVSLLEVMFRSLCEYGVSKNNRPALDRRGETMLWRHCGRFSRQRSTAGRLCVESKGVSTEHIMTNVAIISPLFQFPLKLTRSFVSSGDGLYIPYEPPPDPDPTTSTVDTSSFAKIKPFELITYLKVGRTTHNQYEATPFTVEYIPDLLPGVRMGELKISFEYGHLRPVHNK
jgi:hypothetical protein